ncbi:MULTISPECIES: hypothetical protein [unclassified Flavobacterium]|uniref:hypothetical protein n=1 Tax=unclassified Flavobacterium TaxID=196869 RepID=UPI0012925C0F|nr:MULTISPECIES: hypothetical protein [unclassified Flavobacterium]MQP52730.1 hypothetical protein [Flavobacterium sp. LMO9]MQP62090.1 hypothetical protein [Flavobacterium sp. LMO6]
MELILSKSYIPFLIIIPIILVLAFIKPQETFDVNIGDTYYVIKNSHLGILLSIVYFLLASIHFLSKTYEVKLYDLTIASHTIISILGLILIWFLIKEINKNDILSFEEMLKNIRYKERLTYLCLVILGLMVLSQVILLSDFSIKLFKKLF